MPGVVASKDTMEKQVIQDEEARNPQKYRMHLPAMIPMPLEPTVSGDVRFNAGSAHTLEIDPVKKPATEPNTVEAMILFGPLRHTQTPRHPQQPSESCTDHRSCSLAVQSTTQKLRKSTGIKAAYVTERPVQRYSLDDAHSGINWSSPAGAESIHPRMDDAPNPLARSRDNTCGKG